VTEEEFEIKFNELKEEYADSELLDDLAIAKMVVGLYTDEEEIEHISKEGDQIKKIKDLYDGEDEVTLIGRVFSVSEPTDTLTKAGKNIRFAKVKLVDETGDIVATFWTENIRLLKKFGEGDVVEITRLSVKEFRKELGVSLIPTSTLTVLNNEDYNNLPEYQENITAISDLVPDTTADVVGRIIKISPVRTYDSNGKQGKVASFDVQDASGKITYTLWNNDVNLIEKLELNEGDSVKLLSASVRERNDEISLSQFGGRIIKGDFDVPDFEEEISKISQVTESKDINLLGIVTKVLDTIEFNRNDGSLGYVRSIEITDDTGSIRVTLWNEDTKLEINKGDIIKIISTNIEHDDYSESGYKANTNWNTRLIIGPDDNSSLMDVFEEYKEKLKPIKIGNVQDYEDDGEELDIIGRIVSISEIREFERDDSTQGLVRSGELADETGIVRVSFWDNKAQETFLIGTPVHLENAKTRIGLYAVELNAGRTTRIIHLKDSDVVDLPPLSEIEDNIYTTKKIEELDEDDNRIRVVGRIMDIQEPSEFQRQDGSPGTVRSITLADKTGSIRASLWDNQAEIYFEVGDPVKIQNPRVNYRNDGFELSIGTNSNIERANEEDTKDLPSYEEIEETIYKIKAIADLEDDDRDVKITGKIVEVNTNRILLTQCPSCNNSIEIVDDVYECNYCGESFDEPKNLLMINTRIEDDSEEDIAVTFFGKYAEELLGMTTDEIVSTIDETGDEGAIEGKLEDLENYTITIIADVDFDDFNEEIRLKLKKLISKEI
jgi:replication factor A1